MRRAARVSLFLQLALSLVWPGIAAAQAPPGSQAASATGRQETIALDFYAFTQDGFPVGDLKPEEVQVRIDGRPRTLKWLEWVPVADTPPDATGAPVSPVAPPFASNAAADAGRSFVLVIENESF